MSEQTAFETDTLIFLCIVFTVGSHSQDTSSLYLIFELGYAYLQQSILFEVVFCEI